MSNLEIARVAENWESVHGQVSYRQMDCSHFVVAVLKQAADPNFPYMVANDFRNSHLFRKVDMPQRGDIIQWTRSPNGHVGIVLDPDIGLFIGSQSSTGVDTTRYASGYWAERGTITFLRYQG